MHSWSKVFIQATRKKSTGGKSIVSLQTLDTSPEKALAGIRKLVKAALADMVRSGESPPEPFSLRPYSGKFMVRVPPDIHRMLALQAAESGVSLNRLVSSKLS